MLKIVLTLALCGLAACSFVFVDGPPSAHASMQQFACDESRVWPVIDGGLAAMSIAGIVTAKTQVDTTYGFFGYDTNTTTAKEQVVTGAVGLALYGVSAFIGNRRVSRCRSAYAELAQRLNTTVYARPAPAEAR